MFEAHLSAKHYVDIDDADNAKQVLTDCQEAALQIGATIEKYEPENEQTIQLLSDYCEIIYQIYSGIDQKCEMDVLFRTADEILKSIEGNLKQNIKVEWNIVFFPYKASMWTSFESIWERAVKDDRCRVSVVVIPYCVFDSNMNPEKWICEDALFPEYVKTIPYNLYDLEKEKPDIAFIHNAYDNGNTLTSVLPYFYTENIKKYADCLVYSPYHTLGMYKGEGSDSFFLNAGSINSDKIVVQSEFVSQLYRKYGYSKNKLLVYGSPKVDSIIKNCGTGSKYNRQIDMPEAWKDKLHNKSKIFLLNTHWSYFIQGNEYLQQGYFDFAKRYHDMFWKAIQNVSDRCGLIWRPHPLLISAMEQRCPQSLEYVADFISRIENSNFAVIDRNGDYMDAFNCSDALVTTYSSLINEYLVTGKPIHIFQSKPQSKWAERSPIDYRKCYFFFKKDHGLLFSKFINMVLKGEDPMFDERMEMISSRTYSNMDGTAGEKIFESLMNQCNEDE